MSQTPIPFSSTFRSLTLNVTTGTAPNQVTHTQPITSVHEGNNSVPITDASILTAFNSQAVGTTFTPSIVAKYGSDSNGNALTTVSTPSVTSFIPRVISLANIPNKLTTDTSFSLSSLITTVSAGVLSYSSSNTSVATVNSSTGLVTPVGEGTTTITVSQAATANHRAASASATLTVTLPPPVVLDSNQVTYKFVDSIPTGSENPFFVTSANVVYAVMRNSYDSINKINAYAKGTSGASAPFTHSTAGVIPFDRIVTTLMTNMEFIFNGATTFNSNINSWDTSAVTNMVNMFLNASAFNQPLNSWNVSKVTNMYGMFQNATAFDQPLNSWDVSKVRAMAYMFQNASAFNQPLNSWDVSKVTNMANMFQNASAFNQPLNSWNVSEVRNMNSMFYAAIAFDQPLNSWNVSEVITMTSMFQNATLFNQNISGWVVDNVISKPPTDFSTGSALTVANTPPAFR
jgi:surface protein